MFVLRWLRNTDQAMLSYVWRAWLLVNIPTEIIATTIKFASGTRAGPPPRELPPWFLVVTTVLLAPWIETLIMWPILSALKRAMGNQNTLGIALASASIWGILHGLGAPLWGLAVVWAFFVFSLCFLEWEKKSKRKAIVITALIHTCQNVTPNFVGGLLSLLADLLGF